MITVFGEHADRLVTIGQALAVLTVQLRSVNDKIDAHESRLTNMDANLTANDQALKQQILDNDTSTKAILDGNDVSIKAILEQNDTEIKRKFQELEGIIHALTASPSAGAAVGPEQAGLEGRVDVLRTRLAAVEDHLKGLARQGEEVRAEAKVSVESLGTAMHKSMGEAAERLALLERVVHESVRGGGPSTESSRGTAPAFPWAAAAGPAPAPATATGGAQHFNLGTPPRHRVYDPNSATGSSTSSWPLTPSSSTTTRTPLLG